MEIRTAGVAGLLLLSSVLDAPRQVVGTTCQGRAGSGPPGDRRPFRAASCGRMPATLLLLAAALALLLSGDGGVVQAQERWLVTNIGQVVHSISDLQNEDLAQEFTTGSNDFGYTLSSIALILAVSAVDNLPAVKLFHTSATGTEVATLTTPTSVTAGQHVFYYYTPPAHHLAGEGDQLLDCG